MMAWTQNEIEACIENCKKKAAVDAEFRKKLLFGKHVFTGGAGASTVRLLPALCLTRELADRFLDAFDATLRGK